jgi:hypothetical protein
MVAADAGSEQAIINARQDAPARSLPFLEIRNAVPKSFDRVVTRNSPQRIQAMRVYGWFLTPGKYERMTRETKSFGVPEISRPLLHRCR